MDAVTLAQDRDFRFTLHRSGPSGEGRPLVVTFGGQPSDLTATGFGTAFLLGQGFDTVYVAQRHGTQYQGLAIERFVEVMAPVIAERDVVTYGASLGGYAALYYGGAIDARIIAASPMLPAWRPLRNRAYADLEVTHREVRDGPLSPHAPVVIYDPALLRDVRVVEEMVRPAYPGLRAVEVPHGGHKVLMALERVKQIKPLILGIIERDEVVALSLPGEGTAIWHGERGLALRTTDPEMAVKELERSLSIRPDKRYYNEIIKLLIRRGRMDEAQGWIDRGQAAGGRVLVIVQSMRGIITAAGLRI